MVIRRPSASNSIPLAKGPVPVMANSSAPLARSHMRRVKSVLIDARRRPAGSKPSPVIFPVWPWKERSSRPLSLLQSRMVPSCSPQARSWPPGATATADAREPARWKVRQALSSGRRQRVASSPPAIHATAEASRAKAAFDSLPTWTER